MAKRYRIVGLLGRGGMGEVYRADDLKLGQPVALKFLPELMQRDEGRLERFLNEVKVALKVTHPNVCRVYDIGEVDGQHYLSMEYVDGEDLASLLRRIERLPRSKAAQIARQLCAGLAAAHEQGVLHRDMKPANVLIDGRGQAKIADFGLAGLAEGIGGDEVRAGTPQYMSPEQHAGKEVTVRSDIYSLGLVLYELFTGRRAYEAETAEKMARLQKLSAPRIPSDHVQGLDPAVERVILRCLEREARNRPSSALAVSAALPGGDALAAALAAGETPSPEAVAAAGEVGGLRPVVGLACLVLIVVGLAVIPAVREKAFVDGGVALDLPPEELSATAQEIIRTAGYDQPPADRAFGFEYDADLRHHLRSETAHPPLIHFWYRQSPDHLVPSWGFGRALVSGFRAGFHHVTPENPPSLLPGMVDVRLDGQGRLLRFRAALAQTERPTEETSWTAMFAMAGLDPTSFTPAQTGGNPPVNWDSSYAWAGSFVNRPEAPIRVEAFAFHGRPVFFEVVWPGTAQPRREQSETAVGSRIRVVAFLVTLPALLIVGFVLGRRNLRLGRANRRGAFHLAAFVFVLGIAFGALQTDYPPTSEGIAALVDLAAGCLLRSGIVWLFYVAIEPHARRLWPEFLISWSRLLEGRFRDPMIGRDILVGSLAGLALTFWFYLLSGLTAWLDLPASGQFAGMLESLTGYRMAASQASDLLLEGLAFSLGNLFLLLVILIIVRRQWLAMILFVLGHPVFSLGALDLHLLSWVFLVVSSATTLLVLVRFGLLASAIMMAVAGLDGAFVLASDLSAWYSGRSVVVLAACAAVAAYGFRIALAGRPVFRDRILGG